ncbi:HAD family hydrolase [Pelagibaculum spongiae]|uniref:Beta-phosphoglucomutase family hydrolase n=1 Tax=Pelagibaculum spongiae TaxID=2080658 RepID=A0A2V1H1Y4_9GAMM|nr:beta-phosphoglucomutase family hydrolase [Pelagibaculum spongiae]PVZ70391.1 beta-phosphoglucomutase family hydrolase [Pelagibaculum spongiae]
MDPLTLDLTAYDALIFDLDGTLVDSMPLHLNAWQSIADEFGFKFDPVRLNQLGGVPARKIAAIINKEQGLRIDTLAATKAKRAHYLQNINRADSFASMLNLVRHYHGKLPMAIGTGSPRTNADRVLRNTGLEQYMDAVVTANDVENHKPHPDTFLLAAEKLGIEPKKCLVFEDTEIGREAAHSGGMDCVLINKGRCGEIYPA